VNRVSSINGTSWSGITTLSTTKQPYISFNYDISVVGTNEMYLSGYYQTADTFNNDVVQYGVFGSTTKTIYTELVSEELLPFAMNHIIQALDVGANRYLLYEGGRMTSLGMDNYGSINDAYAYPTIKLMQVGSTSVFNVRDVAVTGTSMEGLHLVYGDITNRRTDTRGAKAENLKDDFQDGVFDSTKWGLSTVLGTGKEINGRLELTLGTSVLEYLKVASVNRFDLTSSYVFCKLEDAGRMTASAQSRLEVDLDSANGLFFNIGASYISCYAYVGSSLSDVSGGGIAYNSVTHKYLRIRESGGTCYFDSSTNGSSWNNPVRINHADW
jgi:hypothetical protein